MTGKPQAPAAVGDHSRSSRRLWPNPEPGRSESSRLAETPYPWHDQSLIRLRRDRSSTIPDACQENTGCSHSGYPGPIRVIRPCRYNRVRNRKLRSLNRAVFMCWRSSRSPFAGRRESWERNLRGTQDAGATSNASMVISASLNGATIAADRGASATGIRIQATTIALGVQPSSPRWRRGISEGRGSGSSPRVRGTA